MSRIPPETLRLALKCGVALRPLTSSCKGFANCCTCETCKTFEKAIAEHRDAGRSPWTADGKLRPRPRKPQPWDVAA